MRAFMVAALALLLVSGTAVAATWNEDGDAGELPGTAQNPIGDGVLEAITGSLTPDADADMYCIRVDDPSVFLATTCGATAFDTQLWLFDPSGVGLAFDDDDPAGCGLQSAVSGAFLPGPGEYLIAVTRYSNDALNAGGLEIWADSPYTTERPPDGPGAADPTIVSWNGGATGTAGPYTIAFTGATFCGEPTPVQDSSWGHIKSMYR